MHRFKLRVEQDTDPMSPREWDNVGTMLCFHQRYSLGDDNLALDHSDFDDWEAIEQHLRKECGAVAMLPLYLMDHSGLSMSTTSFGCRWDSGRVGVIYTTAKRLTEIGVELARAAECLVAEVDDYDRFLRGEIYCFVIEDRHGNVVDSCGGFHSEEDCRSEGDAARLAAIEALGLPCVQRAPACSAEARP
jgi:hypothetical protein